MAKSTSEALRTTLPERATRRDGGVTAIIAAELVERPWTRPGRIARDAEPHRGRFLLLLATLGLVCGWLSCFLAVPSLIGFPVALAAFVVSRQDLRRMQSGAMDCGGYGLTDAALGRSVDGICLNFIAFAAILGFLARLVTLL
jgi:hypothetical protein